MIEIISELIAGENPILLNTLLTGLLASLSFGTVGSIIVTKRISYLIGAIAHSALGGIGIGIYLNVVAKITWIGPYSGGLIFSVLCAIVIGIIRTHYRERLDTLLGAIWSFGMAVGLLFIAKTPGYIDPMNYLFGNILLITDLDLLYMGVLGLVIISLVAIFYNKIFAVSFDEEFSKIRGQNTNLLYISMLVISSIVIVLLIKVVGIILVMALFTLPPAIANFYTLRLWQMMIGSTIVCAFLTTVGTLLSYYQDLPTGPVIILTASIVYLIILISKKLRS
ncbi:MAG: metal ABC transporter permease [Bacteriovoracaceae bacterium]|nr:metal ABC transporter permease [Bacteriovoracaceae bacterium]